VPSKVNSDRCNPETSYSEAERLYPSHHLCRTTVRGWCCILSWNQSLIWLSHNILQIWFILWMHVVWIKCFLSTTHCACYSLQLTIISGSVQLHAQAAAILVCVRVVLQCPIFIKLAFLLNSSFLHRSNYSTSV